MTVLNEKTDSTKKIIHILVTSLCNRNCRYCCNKGYDLTDIPYVTDDELKDAETLCLTGGEPFAFSNPCSIAKHYKIKYPNIKNIYVYTNAVELAEYILNGGDINFIDGVNISIKCKKDKEMFDKIIKKDVRINNLSSNLLYVFENLYSDCVENFKVVHRNWQKDFQPSPDSIFRKA